MDLDIILSELGEFGKYQICVYALLFPPFIFSAFGTLSYVFTAGDIDYRCKIPECEKNITWYEEPWLSFALPYKDGILLNHCARYKSIDNIYHENCTGKIFIQNQTEECHSFIFKNNENTVIKEFNLLCNENNWKRSLVGTLHNIGEFIGMPLAGVISDKFGRKMVITTAVIISSIFGTLKSFSTNYIQFVICEMADAIALGGIYSGIFVLGIELTGPKKRALGGVILSSYYPIGEIILGIIVWLVQDWRIYLRIMYIPGLIIMTYYWILPESIRWLTLHGEREELLKTLERISAVNKKPINENVKKTLEQDGNTNPLTENGPYIQKVSSNNKNFEEETNKPESISNAAESKNPLMEVLKSKIMIFRVLNCSFCWITNAFVYYGLSLSSVVIGGNKYLNFILASFIEIPGNIITSLSIEFFGRKLTLTTSLVISGLSCIIFHFVASDTQAVKLILFLIGKCAITVSFTSLYVAASEFFPTTIRHSLISICSTLGRLGSMIAPQMPMLSSYVDPVLIFGAAALVAGTLAIFFPETLHCKLPDTVEEAKVIGKGSKVGIS